MSKRRRNDIYLLLIFVSAIFVLCFHALYYHPFIADDALISLRYVDRFLEGKGLTWTEGQPVEGYSNLLWMLLIAVLGRLGVDLIPAARVLGLSGMSVVVFSLVYWYRYRNKSHGDNVPLIVGLFFFCMAAPVAVWAIGGLEQPLVAAVVALSIPLIVRTIELDSPRKSIILGLSFVLGLTCVTRPDGPLFAVAAFLSIYIGRFVCGKKPLSFSAAVMLASMPLMFFGGQLLFRLFYYGELIPNTALVKIAPSLRHFARGVLYTVRGMVALFPFSQLAIVFVVVFMFLPHKRSIGIPLLMIGMLWVPYLFIVGGDIFPAYRHTIPLVVVFAFALMEGMESVMATLKRPVSFAPKGFLVRVLVIACAGFLGVQFADSANRAAVSERWEWDGKAIGLLLKGAFSKQQPLLAVTAAGSVPYWSELPALDMLGLNDYYLPRHPPKDFGNGSLAHELGEGNYVLQRRPDIIIFHTGDLKDIYRSGIEMQQTTQFYQLYTVVKVRGSDPRDYTAMLWFHKYSPKIGIERTSSRITIPGFLLNGNPNTIAHADTTGNLVVSVSATEPVSATIDSVSDANWNVAVKASSSEGIWSQLQQEGISLVVTVFSKAATPIEIEEIVLTKSDPTRTSEAGSQLAPPP